MRPRIRRPRRKMVGPFMVVSGVRVSELRMDGLVKREPSKGGIYLAESFESDSFLSESSFLVVLEASRLPETLAMAVFSKVR